MEISLLLNESMILWFCECLAACGNSWWSNLHVLEIQVTLNKAPRSFDATVEILCQFKINL